MSIKTLETGTLETAQVEASIMYNVCTMYISSGEDTVQCTV